MNRLRRRKAEATQSRGAAIRSFLDNTLLLDAPDVPTVGIGPIVWGINPNDGRHWYFVCASADATGHFHLDCIKVRDDDRDCAEQMRLALLTELVARKPIVICDFDAEVPFAAFCADTWPSERTTALLTAVKADYAARTDP